jgi:5-hydroxyisourate hydrolase-like protein (transthyretin family)
MLLRIALVMLLAGVGGAQQLPHPAPGPQSTPQAPSPFTPSNAGFQIGGIVVNSLTGQPLANINVAVSRVTQGSDRDITKSVMTGSDGRFFFTQLSAGKYSLMATGRGFALQYYEHHDPYATAIAIGPKLESTSLVFRMDPDAALEGTVTDENNEPIQYAMVRLFQRSTDEGMQKTLPINQAQTDDQGHYHIGHLEAGTYYLAVSARPWYAQNTRQYRLTGPRASLPPDSSDSALDVTFPLTFYSGALDSADATPIQLTPGERTTADVALHATPSLHVRIHTGEAETPTIGRMIFPHISQRIFEGYVEPVSNAPDSWVAPGVVEISGLAPGHYIVEVPPTSGAGDKGSVRGWYRDVDLAGDVDISIADAPGFVSITGMMVFPASERIPPQMTIQLGNTETGEVYRSDIDDHGGFAFKSDNVRPGRYVVGLENASGYSLEKLAATGAKVAGRSIEVVNNATIRITGVVTHGAAQVTGTAMREGESFSGAMIVLVPQDPANNLPLFRRDQSDSDGTFTLPRVVPGQYSVIAIANGWDLEWANPTVLQPYLKNAETIQVPSGGKVEVKVQVQ